MGEGYHRAGLGAGAGSWKRWWVCSTTMDRVGTRGGGVPWQ
jgi:hypothetical protein